MIPKFDNFDFLSSFIYNASDSKMLGSFLYLEDYDIRRSTNQWLETCVYEINDKNR